MSESHEAHRAVENAIDACWEQACAHWSHRLLLGRPRNLVDLEGLARLNLRTREIEINGALIVERGLLPAMESIIAHEVGHHVRYPGTFSTHTRMLLLERSLVPIEGYSASNLFTDLMINARLGAQPALRSGLIRVYRAFSRELDWELDPAFTFYLAIYEELWGLPICDLIGPDDRFSEAYPGYRAEAQLLGQRLFHLGPNIYTQFLYFVSVLTRYLKPQKGELPESQDPCQCNKGEPSPEDWADALEASAAERRALERALKEGWLSKEQYKRLGGDDAFERRVWGLPGQGTQDAEKVPEIMAAYYRMTAETYLFRPPPQRSWGEAVVPSTLEEWEPGTPINQVDWMATLVQRGPTLGCAQPFVRQRIADYEGLEVVSWQPRVEIYLDVSGSMPDPRSGRNAMTLAAQILTMATIRAGGWVRALLYSSEFVRHWEWCRSEVEISRFLMHYVGGGTRFPFEVLGSSATERHHEPPIRVIISDTDFDRNYDDHQNHPQIFHRAAMQSARLIVMQHRPQGSGAECAPRYQQAGAVPLEIRDFDDFPAMAAQLSMSLFDGGTHGLVS